MPERSIAINLCLKIEGLPQSLRLLKELGGSERVHPYRGERLMRGSMNFRLVNPKSYVVKDYIAQNPKRTASH